MFILIARIFAVWYNTGVLEIIENFIRRLFVRYELYEYNEATEKYRELGSYPTLNSAIRKVHLFIKDNVFLILERRKKHNAPITIFSGKNGLIFRTTSTLSGFSPVDNSEDSRRYWKEESILPEYMIHTDKLKALIEANPDDIVLELKYLIHNGNLSERVKGSDKWKMKNTEKK